MTTFTSGIGHEEEVDIEMIPPAIPKGNFSGIPVPADVHLLVFDLETMATENVTNNNANDEMPMWIGNAIYYMSDNGPGKAKHALG